MKFLMLHQLTPQQTVKRFIIHSADIISIEESDRNAPPSLLSEVEQEIIGEFTSLAAIRTCISRDTHIVKNVELLESIEYVFSLLNNKKQ